MVSPITIIDETSNSDDDEIVFMLNIDISIDGVDCDPEESENDASATTTNTVQEVVPAVEEATTNTVEEVVPAVVAATASSTAAAAASSTAAAATVVEEAAKSIFDEAVAAIEEVTPKKQPSPPKRQPSPPKKQPSPPRRQPSPPKRQPSPPRRVVQPPPPPPRRQPSPPRRVVQPPPPPPPKKKSTYKPMAGNKERIYPRDAPHLSLAVRDGEVVLANKNSGDLNQHWIIYRRFSSGVKDVQGQPTFSIANNGTGKTLQHAIGHNHPIRLTKHYFKEIDRSVLWTNQNFGDSSCTIRSVNDIGLELVSANQDGYRDGIKALLYNYRGAGHQYWKITNW